MASLRLVVVAAVLKCILAETLTPDQVRENQRAAVNACRHESTAACLRLCLFKNVGILDTDGRYVESKAIETMTTMVMVSDAKLNQEQVNSIAKTCNSVNEDIKEGCERGQQVFSCIDDEKLKLTGKRL